jgi:thiol-disulfide isomerase/thioredoxin
MVRAILLTFMLAAGAEFVEYEDWFSGDKQEGRHYVLVSAEWCPPCNALKKRLKSDKYSGQKIIILDIDKHPEVSAKILKGRGVPTVIEYNLSGGEWKPARIWDGVDLDKFLRGE